MDYFSISYYFIYLIAQSAPHWWGMFFTQQTSCLPYVFLMVHRYIYSRYFSVFLTLYQLYHSLPSSTLISSSSLYLKLQLLKVITPYRIKKIISSNTVELELPSTIKIYPVVNVSRIHKYVGQVEGQKREQPAPVIIEGEE